MNTAMSHMVQPGRPVMVYPPPAVVVPVMVSIQQPQYFVSSEWDCARTCSNICMVLGSIAAGIMGIGVLGMFAMGQIATVVRMLSSIGAVLAYPYFLWSLFRARILCYAYVIFFVNLMGFMSILDAAGFLIQMGRYVQGIFVLFFGTGVLGAMSYVALVGYREIKAYLLRKALDEKLLNQP